MLKPGKQKDKIPRYVLTLSSELEIWSFHVVELQKTEKKCTSFHTTRAERLLCSLINKHLMTGPKGNSEFCFPETLNVPQGEAEGNIEVEGKQNSLFPEGPVIKCFVIPPNSK